MVHYVLEIPALGKQGQIDAQDLLANQPNQISEPYVLGRYQFQTHKVGNILRNDTYG